MYFANFLHIYQPAKQQKHILEAVVKSCYRPLLKGLKAIDGSKITLNISGSLTELLDNNGFSDVLSDIKELLESGRLELTGSAKYHAFLPLLPDDEIIRQIKINDQASRFYFGGSYKPRGFFPPEMGFTQKLSPILDELGFDWVILDEIAYKGGQSFPTQNKLYKIEGLKNLHVFFRNRNSSNLIMSAAVRSLESIKQVLSEDLKTNAYIISGMDGETFGHHRPGLETLLFDLLSSKEANFVGISDLLGIFNESEDVQPVSSTWASSAKDIKEGIQFISWNDPTNKLHSLQWALTNLVLAEVKKHTPQDQTNATARLMLDMALASDQFFWACAKPWWSVEMIEEGAFILLSTVRSISQVSEEVLGKASKLYEEIVSKAFDWQRSDKIRELHLRNNDLLRIPFKERTFEKGGSEEGVYNAFIAMMRALEKKASEQREYEQAIMWRDAVYKLENKLDIYDTINVVDLLRTKISNEEVEKTLDKYTAQYKELRGGQPEQRD
ncbi:MAG: hypothetical protein AAB443_03925 [Patescibacteria group bacterium]